MEFPRIFFCKKRGECGNLSVKMDSRVRGNDGGNPHILREKLILEFPQNDRKIKFTIPANAGISAEIPIYIGMEKRRRKKTLSFPRKRAFGAINFGILANAKVWNSRAFFCKKRGECGILSKAGIYSGRLILEFFANFSRKFGIPAHFFCKKRGECGILSVKMDSRVRGNDKQKTAGIWNPRRFFISRNQKRCTAFIWNLAFSEKLFLFSHLNPAEGFIVQRL